MFAGLKRVIGARRGSDLVRLKSAPKSKNKNYNHFKPIKGQASVLTLFFGTGRLLAKLIVRLLSIYREDFDRPSCRVAALFESANRRVP
jgi:hypothetical protein